MKTILICKDCFDQFESFNNNEDNTSSDENLVGVFFTECMGVCPKDKISVIELNKESTNSMKSKSLSINQINEILNRNNN